MLRVDEDKIIHITRGDAGVLRISANDEKGETYIFKAGEIVRFKVVEKNACNSIAFKKEVVVNAETTEVEIELTTADTKIGEIINKPKDYWYEVELNPDTAPYTIIGYDMEGPKVLRMYPEGDDNHG